MYITLKLNNINYTTYTLGSINKEYLEHSIKHKYKDTPLLKEFNIYED